MVRVGLLVALTGCWINNGNEAPSIEPLQLTTMEDKSLRVTVIAHDVDGDDLDARLRVTGSASLTTQTIDHTRDDGATRLALVMVFAPRANFHGDDGFTVEVTDGVERTVQFIDIAVTPVNDRPVGEPDVLAAKGDVPRTIFTATLLANDHDVDDAQEREPTSLVISRVANPAHGIVTLGIDTITFVPDAGFSGTASFEYTVSDGIAEDEEVRVLIAVAGPNAAPVAKDDRVLVMEDEVLRLLPPGLLENDVDQDGQALEIIAVGNATHGTVEVTAGIVTFTPERNYFGPAAFDYTVTDGVAIDTAHVDIEIAPWL